MADIDLAKHEARGHFASTFAAGGYIESAYADTEQGALDSLRNVCIDVLASLPGERPLHLRAHDAYVRIDEAKLFIDRVVHAYGTLGMGAPDNLLLTLEVLEMAMDDLLPERAKD